MPATLSSATAHAELSEAIEAGEEACELLLI
jgi:hypothetical protein